MKLYDNPKSRAASERPKLEAYVDPNGHLLEVMTVAETGSSGAGGSLKHGALNHL